MAPLYWMKLWYEILDDPKIGMLSDHLKWTTIQMFLCAGENNKDGLLPPVEYLAWRLRVQANQLSKDLEALARTGIIQQTPEGWFVTNFKARQAKPTKADYMRRRRERERNDRYYGYGPPVTNGNNSVTDSVTNGNTDTDTDTDTEEDRDQTGTEKHQRTLQAIKQRANDDLLDHLKTCHTGERENTLIIYAPDQETKTMLLNGASQMIHDIARGFSGYRNVEIELENA